MLAMPGCWPMELPAYTARVRSSAQRIVPCQCNVGIGMVKSAYLGAYGPIFLNALFLYILVRRTVLFCSHTDFLKNPLRRELQATELPLTHANPRNAMPLSSGYPEITFARM